MFYSRHSYEIFADMGKFLDKSKNLLYMPVSRIIYTHTVHAFECAHHIAESLEYAHYILHIDKAANKKTADLIINEALNYQCLDVKSPLFGFWNLFSEEDVSELLTPDYGFCCRIAATLFQLYEYYTDFLPDSVIVRIKSAFLNTLYALMANYTPPSPIATLETVYVTLAGGKTFNNPEHTQFGEQCLRLFYNSTTYNNSMIAHNDMMFSVSCLRLLTMIADICEDEQIKKMVLSIQDMLWSTLAYHYHAATKQIAGATTLTESDFTGQIMYNFIQGATDGKVSFSNANPLDNEITKCPPEYLPFFDGSKRIEYSQKLVSYGMAFPYFLFSKVASTYMRPDYTFGTYNRELFWLQIRPFIGYINSENSPYCFKLQVLHDHHDYLSAALHCLQHYGHSIGHISFLTNKGDRSYLDGNHPKIKATDLRIRFTLIGNVENLEIIHSRESLTVKCRNVTVYFAYTFFKVSGYDTKIRFSEDDGAVYFDAIIYSGEEKTIDFTAMEQAICGFNFLITSSGKKPFVTENTTSDSELISTVSTPDVRLKLVTPFKPGFESVCMGYDRQYINNYTIEEYAVQTAEKAKGYSYIEKMNMYNPVSLPVSDIASVNKELSRKIDNISETPFDDIVHYIESILDIISKNGYSLTLQRRMSIQIMVNLFDYAKNINPKFNEMINDKYTTVFRKIITAENFDSIRKNTLHICNMIKKDKTYLESKYVNKEIIIDIFKLISDNLLNPDLSLEFVADNLGYSTSHISRLFVESTGLNYIKYVQKEKMNYALKQLRSKKMSITEVSEKIGYSSPNSFMRTFKKTFGMTVNKYLNSGNP